MTWEVLAWTMFVIFIVCFSIPALAAVLWIIDTSKARRVIRYNILTRYNPDELGNRPYFYDPATGTAYEPESGNSPALPPVFINGLQPQPLQSPNPTRRGSTAVSINTQPSAFYVEEVDIPVNGCKSDLQPPNADLQPLQLGKFTDLLPQMRQLIQEGRTKTAVLQALGLTGRHYKTGSEFYEQVLASITLEGGNNK